jgi:hypothetical protein
LLDNVRTNERRDTIQGELLLKLCYYFVEGNLMIIFPLLLLNFCSRIATCVCLLTCAQTSRVIAYAKQTHTVQAQFVEGNADHWRDRRNIVTGRSANELIREDEIETPKSIAGSIAGTPRWSHTPSSSSASSWSPNQSNRRPSTMSDTESDAGYHTDDNGGDTDTDHEHGDGDGDGDDGDDLLELGITWDIVGRLHNSLGILLYEKVCALDDTVRKQKLGELARLHFGRKPVAGDRAVVLQREMATTTTTTASKSTKGEADATADATGSGVGSSGNGGATPVPPSTPSSLSSSTSLSLTGVHVSHVNNSIARTFK